jgi:hypothetical protein
MEDNNDLQIELTLESGLVCDFAPDFKLSTNYADKDKVSWRLSDQRTAIDVGLLFPGVQVEDSIHASRSDRDDL